MHIEEDRANVFRFARTFNEVTIVTGKGDYAAAVTRLKEGIARTVAYFREVDPD